MTKQHNDRTRLGNGWDLIRSIRADRNHMFFVARNYFDLGTTHYLTDEGIRTVKQMSEGVESQYFRSQEEAEEALASAPLTWGADA